MENGYSTLRPQLPHGVKLYENIYVTMRDGVKIAVDVYLPEMEGRYPGLLSLSPYNKEVQQHPPQYSHTIEAGATDFFVPKGYVHIIAQGRGSGLSQGQYHLLDLKEQQDGYDLVEWIAHQPWCDGNVGMFGDSYFAMIQYLVAAQNPPHLKCIVPYDGLTDTYRDFCYPGGILFASFLAAWGLDQVIMNTWPGPIEGKLPPANWFADLASNPEDGPYYWERSAWKKLDKINVPMLCIVAQLDFIHSRGQLHAYPMVKSPKKLLVVPPCGPFTHVQFLRNRPLNEQMLRWYDYWLKGIDTGIMNDPEVAIYDSTTQEWRYENEYPLARTEWSKFYLRSNPEGPANEPPYGLISEAAPGNEYPDKYNIPESTNVLRSGRPVLAYATPPLVKEVRVWGPLSTVLFGSSTTLDTLWFVKLADVSPDGRVTMLTNGQLRASFREIDESRSKPGQPFHPFQNPVNLNPNIVYEFQIEMMPIFHTFKVGHKIWVQIASDDLSFHSPAITDIHSMPMPAENSVYHDLAHPSHVLLPTIPDCPEIKPVEPPVSQIAWPTVLDDYYRTTRRLMM